MGSQGITVVGLGKLGLPLALILAEKGFAVTGFDTDPALRGELVARRTRLHEPGVAELLATRRLTIADTVAEAVAGSAISFVIVPTPSDAAGRFSSAQVVEVVRAIGSAVAGQGRPHLVVVVSTLMPGAMAGAVRPALREAAGGAEVELCYCPEFVALGTVLRDMRRPDLVLIGEDHAEAGDALVTVLSKIWETSPAVVRMNCVNAELAKLTVNTMITARISAANQIAELCEALPGADAAVVLGAAGHDRRIGPACLRPATAFGGPCFPRDNAALIALGQEVGISADLALATQAINARQSERVVARLRELCPEGTVAVLGLAYKPGTDVADASAGLAMANSLVEHGYRVIAYDPLCAAPAALSPQVELAANVRDCLAPADGAIVALPCEAFTGLPADSFAGKTVIDCWGTMPDMPGRHRLGVGAMA